MAIELTADTSIAGSATVEVTFYEDPDQDGTYENSDTTSLNDGIDTYVLGDLDGSGDVYYEIRITGGTTDDISIRSLEITKKNIIAGSVLDGDQWIDATAINYHDGSSWQPITAVKYYDGSTWTAI